MSLDKAISSGKEHRAPYRGSKAFDKSCRNHGNHGHGPGNECPYCASNRQANSNRKLEQTSQDLNDLLYTGIDAQHDTDYYDEALTFSELEELTTFANGNDFK